MKNISTFLNNAAGNCFAGLVKRNSGLRMKVLELTALQVQHLLGYATSKYLISRGIAIIFENFLASSSKNIDSRRPEEIPKSRNQK